MGDVISWGLITGVKKIVKGLTDTVEEQFDGFIDDATEVVNSLGVGCLPMPLSSAGLTSISTDDGVQLSYTLDTGSMNTDNAALRTEAAAVVLVRNAEHYPTTPADGVQIYEDTDLYTVGDTGTLTPKAKTFTDTGLTQNETYYYSAFPRTPGGVYDYSPRDVRHRTKMTWVGNKGTISVNVQTPEGYTGTLGEYTITLVDQASESPQNVEQTFSGTGVKRMNGLTGGKQYKVRLSSTTDLQAPPDSEVISVVGGQNYDITMTYALMYGTITVNVTTTPTGMPIGAYTVTLTPNDGTGAVQQSGNNSQAVVFSNVKNGVVYTVGLSAINHYTANAGGTVTAVGGQNISHNANYAWQNISFANCSWSELSAIAEAGKASACFSVHDERDIVVGDETLTFEIIGFNHDQKTSGGYAGLSIAMKNLMENTRQMNSTNTNVGSFTGSAMYDYLSTGVYNSLQSDLKAVIKPVNKKTSAGNKSSAVNTESMKLWLFSVNELVGTQGGSWVSNNEGSKYAAFSNDSSRIKKLSNGSGSANWWWPRSPDLHTSNCFCYVGSSGGLGYNNNASASGGVCFGFCI